MTVALVLRLPIPDAIDGGAESVDGGGESSRTLDPPEPQFVSPKRPSAGEGLEGLARIPVACQMARAPELGTPQDRTVTIRITDCDERPLKGVRVGALVGALPAGGYEVSAVSDGEGECEVTIDAGWRLLRMEASYPGYAPKVLGAVVNDEVLRADIVPVVLDLAAELIVTVVDGDGLPLSGHPVDIALSPKRDDLRSDCRVLEGAYRRFNVRTDRHGVARFQSLARGWWGVKSYQWKDWAQTDWVHADCSSGRQEVRIVVGRRRWKKDSYASGQMHIPDAECAEGKTEGYYLCEPGMLEQPIPLYSDCGDLVSFFVPVRRGQERELIVAFKPERKGTREAVARSQPFTLVAGEHGMLVTPSWL